MPTRNIPAMSVEKVFVATVATTPVLMILEYDGTLYTGGYNTTTGDSGYRRIFPVFDSTDSGVYIVAVTGVNSQTTPAFAFNNFKIHIINEPT